MLLHECEIPRRAIQPNLHLTVYHGRRPLPGLTPDGWDNHIVADSLETRFMVLAPSGENPRPELKTKSAVDRNSSYKKKPSYWSNSELAG